MAEALQTKGRFHVRRGGAAEIKKIEDPAEFAIAAADYLGVQPISIPLSSSLMIDYPLFLLNRCWDS